MMPMVAHPVENARIGTVQVEQNIASVLVEVVRVNMDIESFTVAYAQESTLAGRSNSPGVHRRCPGNGRRVWL
jgi:hypothetical protein